MVEFMGDGTQKRVLLTRRVARKWLEEKANPEYRMSIFGMASKIRRFPDLLRSFRDGKLKIGGISPVRDLGIKEGFDSVTVWSSDRESLISLKDWCERMNLETSGIW